MAMTPHTIHPGSGAKKKSKRVGRGSGSQKGTTAGRGTKGQRARSGGRSRTKILGFRQSLLKIPKLRGFKSRRAKPAVVTLTSLNRIVEAGDIVTPAYLVKKSVIHRANDVVKVVGNAELTKKIFLQGCLASASVLKAIEKAGGTVTF